MAQAAGLRPSEVYDRCCELGLFSAPPQEVSALRFVRRLMVRLRLPCPFLEGGRCSIHWGRAIACALFPESHYAQGAWDERLCEYPCLREVQPIGPARRRWLRELEQRSAEESLVSDILLFGHSPFLVVFERNDQLVELARERARARGLFTEGDRLLVPQEVFEELLRKELAGGEFQEDVRRRVAKLDQPEGVRELFRVQNLLTPLTAHPSLAAFRVLHQLNRGGFRLAR